MAEHRVGSPPAGRRDEAREAFRRSIEINQGGPPATPASASWSCNRATAGRRSRRDAGRRSESVDFDALFNLGTELINDGQAAAARPYVERFVRAAPPAIYAKDIARLRAWLARSSG